MSPGNTERGYIGAEGGLRNEQSLQSLAEDQNAWGYRKAVNTIERFLLGLMGYTTCPKGYWKRIRTASAMDQANKEMKQRTKVIGAFPDEEVSPPIGRVNLDGRERGVGHRQKVFDHAEGIIRQGDRT